MAVYFIQAGGECGPVKIGLASDVAKRLASLQCGSWQELRAIRVVDGDLRHERWLQQKYRGRRIQGEWFTFCPTMLTIIPETKVVNARKRVLCNQSAPSVKVLSAFGGIHKASRALGVPASTVQGWWERGFIPARRYDAVYRKAAELGLGLTAQDFIGRAA